MDTSAEAFDAFVKEREVAKTPAPEAPPADVVVKEPEVAVELPPPEPEKPAEEPQKPEPAIPLNRHKAILKEARERHDAQLSELNARIAEMAEKTPAKQIEALEKLRENLPEELVDTLTQQLRERDSKLDVAMARIERAEAALLERELEIQSAEAAKVAQALDEMPTLKQWQKAAADESASEMDKALWDAAVKLDVQLRDLPAWANKSMVERFAKVQERVAEDFGIETPKPAPAPTTKALPKKEAVMPASLSNMPAAKAPAQVSADMSNMGFAAKLAAAQTMTDAQLQKAMLFGG